MCNGRAISLGKLFLIPIFIVALLTLCAPCVLAGLGNGKLQIHHIDVGQGDGAIIISPQGQIVLVDDGTYTNCSQFLNYVQSLGITNVDYHFASHYHADHIGCLCDLFAAGVVLNIAGYDRGYSYTTQTYQDYVTCLGGKRQTMAKNQTIILDAGSANSVLIKCVDLNGAGVYSGSDENANSMVLKVTYGNFDEVMGGDLTASPSVEPTVGPEVGDVEVYKVHHHSSATSSYDSWLNATTPEVAVISLGNNGYGYPTSATLARLHNHGVKTYWTEIGSGASPTPGWDKVGGTIIIEADPWSGAAYTVRGNGFVDTYYNSGSTTVTETTWGRIKVLYR
jgi:beta-lactamase superfamily II metal-dependent hydrolase